MEAVARRSVTAAVPSGLLPSAEAGVFVDWFCWAYNVAAMMACACMRPAITSSGECMPARMRFSPSSREREINSW